METKLKGDTQCSFQQGLLACFVMLLVTSCVLINFTATTCVLHLPGRIPARVTQEDPYLLQKKEGQSRLNLIG